MRSCFPFRRGLVSCLLASAAILPSPALARQADAPTGTGTANAPELVSVTGDRLARWVPKDSSAATKTDQPLITTPESVSVVTRAQMDEQNARTLGEALRYTAGVASEADRGYSTRYDLVSIRGFQSNGDQYLDGLRLFGGAYYAVQKIDPFLLDGYQVLKGPPSVLYGQSSPGGIIALTPKAPTAARVRDAEIEGGTFGYVRGTADLGGRIDENGHWLFRLPVTGTTSGSQDRNTHTDTVAAMPSLSWLPTDRDTLTVTGLVQWDPRGGDYNTAPINGTILPNPNGRFENDYYPGDRKFETFDQTQLAIGYRYEHRFNPDWSFRSLGRYADVGEQYQQVYGSGILDADLRTDGRYTAASKEHFDTITLEQQLVGHVDTGPVRHSLLFGVNWQNLRDHYNFYGGTAPSIDAFAPNNDQPIPAPTLSLDRGVSTNQEGIFAQDEMVLGRLHGQIGVREDWSEIATRDVLYPSTDTDQGDRAFTWRAGILYALPQGVSPYFNYARSFQPTNQTDFFGTPFKPTRGEQYEVGVKYQPNGFNGFFTAALFHLRENDALAPDPDPTHLFASVQTGAIRSQGVELELHAFITRDLYVQGAYTYQDVSYVGGGNGALEGKRPTWDPAQFFSLRAHYAVQHGRLNGLGFGVGMRYEGNTVAYDSGDGPIYGTPSFALVDAEASYALGGLVPALRSAVLQVTAQNLLDTRTITSCYSLSFGCQFGAGRNVIGRLSYHW